MPRSFVWRVFFQNEGVPPRDVYAATPSSAERTAIYAEKVTGCKVKRLRVRSVRCIREVGYGAQPELFPTEEVQKIHDAPLDSRA